MDNMTKDNMTNEKKRDLLLPASILIAALLISGALVYNVGSKAGGSEPAVVKESPKLPAGSSDTIKIRPVTASDHIRGNPDAPIKIVEFSDLECPFCKRFHPTMQRIVSEYDNQVAWVYRHFPLDVLHSKARTEAIATECAADLGGNSAFWAYVDKIFEVTPSNNGLDLNLLPVIASEIGLDRDEFQKCLDSGKFDQHVEEDVQDANLAGGRGTPYSVMIVNDGERYIPISGAQPYNVVKLLIDNVLKSF